ncbi:DUF397 domain-containing protein [Streptomyces sp. NPDC059256]|uniref:DUF397 domain-containing protein n=1 Tax=Streptomyces sp. NPDC059256 TaxID=3346794 RepID=UPI0036C437F0
MPDTSWQQSSFCAGGGNNCVQVKEDGQVIRVRESQSPSESITMTPTQFAALVQSIKAGDWDHLI